METEMNTANKQVHKYQFLNAKIGCDTPPLNLEKREKNLNVHGIILNANVFTNFKTQVTSLPFELFVKQTTVT